MIDLYLRADSETALIAALADLRGTDMDGNPVWLTASHDHALDVIGVIYKPTGETTETPMGPVPIMAATPGYHANLRLRQGHPLIDTLTGLLANPEPSSPARQWA